MLLLVKALREVRQGVLSGSKTLIRVYQETI